MPAPGSTTDIPVSTREFFGPSRVLKAQWRTRIDSLAQMLEAVTAPPLIHTQNLGRIVRPESLIVRPKRRLEPGTIFCAPRFRFDRITRHLSWEDKTWRQKVLEETERAILAPPAPPTPPAFFISRTAYETIRPVLNNHGRTYPSVRLPCTKREPSCPYCVRSHAEEQG